MPKQKVERGDAKPTLIHVSTEKKPIFKKIAKEKGLRSSTKHLAEHLLEKEFKKYKKKPLKIDD